MNRQCQHIRSFAQCANVLTWGVRMCGGERRAERLIKDTAGENTCALFFATLRSDARAEAGGGEGGETQLTEKDGGGTATEVRAVRAVTAATKRAAASMRTGTARVATTVCGGLTRGTNLQPLGDGQ